ncbi:MAG TPA: ribosome maturation factor RimM [Dehalococcoidia bacterium]
MTRGSSSKSARPGDDVADGYVAVGRVLAPFGVHGEARVEPLAPPQTFAPGRSVTLRGDVREIESSRRHKGFVLLKLSGIDTPEEVAAYRDQYLQVPEGDLAALEEGEYYRYELIGLRVVSTEGEDLGEVAEVLERPANDVFVVRGPKGEALIPAVDDIVREVDVESGVITVEVVPGLLP